MRTTLISIIALAACGGGGKPANTTPTDSTATTTSGAAKTGTSGVKNLDWGAGADAISAAFPQATPQPGGMWSNGTSDGIEAITSFKLGAHGLEKVAVEWTSGFISMDDCATGWKKVRAIYDGRFGASQADNLAASWKTPTVSVTLTCSPNESGAGVLSATFAQPDAK